MACKTAGERLDMHLLNLHGEVTTCEQSRRLVVRIETSITAASAEAMRMAIQSARDEPQFRPEVSAASIRISRRFGRGGAI
jgi:hypothetical protein